jgi:hypothetical protein
MWFVTCYFVAGGSGEVEGGWPCECEEACLGSR